jgi:outer membrane usher protein
VPARDRRRVLFTGAASAAVAFAVSAASARAATATATANAAATSNAAATADIAADLAATAAVRDPPAPQTLELDVVINGHQIGKIGEFVEIRGVLMAKRQELTDLGLRLPANVVPLIDDLIALTSLPGVNARFDATTQTIYITAPSEALLPNLLRPAANPGPAIPLESAVGATLNYDVVGAVTNGHAYGSGLFDARVFSPIGIASTDFLAYGGASPNRGQNSLIRLDSTYVYSDFNAQRRYWLGDFITGGLSWTRPVRLGGAQITRDFTMRPDLVTFPVPIVSGTAAVPSTVDVLVNGTRVLSSQAQPGPFQVPQLPIVTGAGQVQVAVTNALGQQVTTTLPFYASASLLSPGLHTYSVEAGFVRRNWGLISNDYGTFAASGTYRRGLTDDITIEAHAEGTKGQFMGGGGIVANAFNFAVINLGGAASTAEGHSGGELSVGIERTGHTFSFGATAILATPGFRDIASLNGDPVPTRQITANAAYYMGHWGSVGLAWLQVDRPASTTLVSIVGPPAFTPPGGPQPPSGVAIGDTGLPFLPAQTSQVLTASYSVQLFHRLFLYADGFHDFARGGGDGASIGITIPLGRRTSVSASGSYASGTPAYGQVQAQQNVTNIGDVGYQLYLADGGFSHEFGQVQYKSPWGLFTAGVDHFDSETTFRLEAQGALSFADNRLFASNTVNQSFAVVDTGGVRGVHVLYENRPDGVTDASGRLLVPDLLSWNVNRLAIDPADVPLDAQVPYTERQVRPPDRSGVVVKFPIRKTNGALLVLVDDTGHPIPVGSAATLEATGIVAPVGYDGETFIENLGKTNQLVVQLPNDGRCVVTFNFSPTPGDVPRIGPLTCRRDDR